MTHAAPGRHRAAPSPDGRWTGGLKVGLVVVLSAASVAAVVLVVLAVLVTNQPSDPVPATSDRSAAAASSPAPGRASVETTRTTTIAGDVVIVDEVSQVVSDGAAVAQPSRATPTGLRLIGLQISGQDGRSSPFSEPVEIGPDGVLTVSARYRLTACPDILPALWPAPTRFPQATQTYVRLEQPQHTAAAICPGERARSTPQPEIDAEVTPGVPVRVTLSWDGGDTLSINGIGSASGVAAISVQSAADCSSDPSCIAILDAVTQPGQVSTATFTMKTVDPCPPGTTSDRLVLLVSGGSAPPQPVSVRVEGLHRAICGA